MLLCHYKNNILCLSLLFTPLLHWFINFNVPTTAYNYLSWTLITDVTDGITAAIFFRIWKTKWTKMSAKLYRKSDSMDSIVVFCSCYTVCLWALLSTFRRYMLSPASGSVCVGWWASVYLYLVIHDDQFCSSSRSSRIRLMVFSGFC